MTKRIIGNKKIDLTDAEFKLYQDISRSYDKPNFKGSQLFVDLFETNEDGIITFLKPPSKFTSMEVFLYMMSVFCHQHLREMYKKTDEICDQLNQKVDLLDSKLALLDEKIRNS